MRVGNHCPNPPSLIFFQSTRSARLIFQYHRPSDLSFAHNFSSWLPCTKHQTPWSGLCKDLCSNRPCPVWPACLLLWVSNPECIVSHFGSFSPASFYKAGNIPRSSKMKVILCPLEPPQRWLLIKNLTSVLLAG